MTPARTIDPKDYDFPFVIARYVNQGREYTGNQVIEALPKYPKTRALLMKKLGLLPKFTKELRRRTFLQRRIALKPLARFFLATPHVCELADHIWSQVVEGYSQRKPHTAQANRILQEQYLSESLEEYPYGIDEVQWVSALTGIPGRGKTTAVARIARRLFPPLIYHPVIDVWQIPILLIQMPYHGRQGVSLAVAIIEAIHKVFPLPDYHSMYLKGPRSEARLMADAKRLLAVHFVGLLVVDDAQNTGPEPLEQYAGGVLTLPEKRKTPVSWTAGLLFQASKSTHVPLLLVATAELEVALGKTLSKLRLKFGNGLPHWDPMDSELSRDKPSEFDIFMNAMWPHTLLQQHPAYDFKFRSIFLYHTYGIPDFVVKLYYIVQWRMLQEGKETFTPEDVHRIALKYMGALSRLARSMRKLAENNQEARDELAAMPDLALEFDLKQSAAGAIEKPKPSEKALLEDALLYPPLKRTRKAPAKQEPAPDRPALPKPVVADAAAIGDDS